MPLRKQTWALAKGAIARPIGSRLYRAICGRIRRARSQRSPRPRCTFWDMTFSSRASDASSVQPRSRAQCSTATMRPRAMPRRHSHNRCAARLPRNPPPDSAWLPACGHTYRQKPHWFGDRVEGARRSNRCRHSIARCDRSSDRRRGYSRRAVRRRAHRFSTPKVITGLVRVSNPSNRWQFDRSRI
jgi:hypothetical protein